MRGRMRGRTRIPGRPATGDPGRRGPTPALPGRTAGTGAAALLLAGAAWGCGGGAPPATPPSTNLIVVTVSSLRADHLGIYGYPRHTSPRFDLFAASGALFLEALTPWPETAPAAASALSGLDPAFAAGGSPARLRSGEVAGRWLPLRLREHGYRTFAAVDHPALAAPLGFAEGFDRAPPLWRFRAEAATEAVAAFAEEALAGPDTPAPFFLWLHFSAPGEPDAPPDDDLAALSADGLGYDEPRFDPGPTPRSAVGAGEPSYRVRVDRYDAAIRSVDRAFGRVLDALGAGPAAGRTLVAVVGLHGESLGEHGPVFETPRGLFHEWLRVPFAVGRPGAEVPPFPAGMRFPGVVSLADLAPTVLALLGAAPARDSSPERIGRSLAPALAGEDPRPHARLYAASDQGLFGIYDGRLKMLRIPRPGAEPPFFAVFDRRRDPNEAENRYPEASRSLEPLRARLDTRRIRTVAWGQRRQPEAEPPAIPDDLRRALESRNAGSAGGPASGRR